MNERSVTAERVTVEVIHVEVPIRLMADAWIAAATRGADPAECRGAAMEAFMETCDAPGDVGFYALPNVRAVVLAEHGEAYAGEEVDLGWGGWEEDEEAQEEPYGLLPGVPDLFDGSVRC